MTVEPLLRVEQLSRRGAFAPVSWTVAAGERVALVNAPDTLLRTVAVLLTPHTGRIYFEGADLTRLGGQALRRLRQRLQFVGNDTQHWLPGRHTVGEVLLEPLQIHALGPAAEQRARAEAVADQLGLSPMLWEQRVNSLSPALRQRLALARALTLHPRLLLCTDPVKCLEPAAARSLLESLSRASRLAPAPMAWMWSTSQLDLARTFADRVWLWQADGGFVSAD